MSSPLSGLVPLGEGVDLLEAFTGGLSALADFVQSWDFGALPPEVNSARLTFGPGPAPMAGAAGAYTGLAGALNGAAAASDGSTTAMSVSWRGAASDKAQAAFRNHANWLRGQAALAEEAAGHANAVAAAYAGAYSAMPPLPLIIGNRVATAVLVATNAHGGNTPAIMINEMIYYGMWIDAAATMYAYHGAVVSTLLTLPRPLPPPSITTGAGGGPDPFTGPPLNAGWSPGATGGAQVPGSGGGPDGGNGGGGSNSGGGDGGGNGGGDGGGNTAPDPTQGTGADQAISDVNQAAGSMDDSMNPDGSGGDYLQQHGFFGTSPYSTTLSGLNGGAGSVVAFSMMRGGIGTMPGTATGFKMPANWRMSASRAFGASEAESDGAPAGRPAPRRGVSAPKEQMRRRRRKNEKNKSEKVFVPGDMLDVPVLERPPTVGVIESEDDLSPDGDGTESVTLGVLGRSDDESAAVLAKNPA